MLSPTLRSLTRKGQMPIPKPLALQRSHSRDWSITRMHRNGPDGYGQAIRFPIRLPVRYQIGREFGWGESANIGSTGALFTTDRDLALNACIELNIKWPVLLHDSVQLSLIASGTIIRTEPGRAEIAIGKYEFRTCAPSSFQRPQAWRLPDRTAPGAGWLEFPQPEVEDDDARWERVFREKFAVPEYYNSRWPPHSSPTVAF